jgi:hypothetical protein
MLFILTSFLIFEGMFHYDFFDNSYVLAASENPLFKIGHGAGQSPNVSAACGEQ